MTGKTGADHAGVVYPGDRCPAGSAVAVVTKISGKYVPYMFPGSGSAIVAACAVAGDAGVIEHRISPAIGVVTVITGITAGNVAGRFTGSGGSVVAGKAGADHAGVVHARYG